MTLWFFAMSRITVAELTALNYVTPIFVTIGAAIFLGEAQPRADWPQSRWP